jgi:hypothetical protein
MATASWYARSNGKVFGPYDGKQISEMALAGRISAHTELATSPEGPWHKASAVRGLKFSRAAGEPVANVAAPAPPPLPTSGTLAGKQEAAPQLWNPNAAANWSLVFTPAFGAFLHARNWKALGQPERATINLVWVVATAVFLAINFVTVFMPASQAIEGVMRLAGMGLLCGWYFTQGRPQAQYVKDKFGNSYSKKGWALPLLVGVLSTGMYVATCFGLAMAASRPSAETLAVEVRPLILQEMQKKPGLQGFVIQDITLVHKGGNTYTGFLDATLNGVSERITLEVTHDGRSILWELKPASN